MDTSQIITILQAVIGILVCVMFVLIAVYFLISRKKENDDSKMENEFIVEDKKKTGLVTFEKLATNDALSSLSDREQQILNERYIIGKTQMEIAKDMEISQAQVSRLEKNAIKQLKKTLR